MRSGLLALVFCSLLGQGVNAQSRLIIVSGIGGDPEYSERFYEWAVTLIDAATQRHHVPLEHVTYLAERVERDPDRIDGRATKEAVESAFQALAREAGPNEMIHVVLIGHGSTQGEESRFNLPGPDPTAEDFDRLLDAFPTQRIVFVNAATASGGFVPVLSAPNRIVVAATKTGFERNEAIFGEYFVKAYAEDVADVDKDQRVSVLEAFAYAVQEVRRVYEADNRLLTEHAILDDNADGEGSTEPTIDGPDGSLAATSFLGVPRPTLVAGTADSVLTALYEEKRVLEERIAALRTRSDQLEQAEYERRLEDLLVDLALKNREIREREGGP